MKRNPVPRRCATILAAAWLLLPGCSDSTSPPAVASVSVTAAATEVAAGELLQLSAVVRDAAGNVLTDRPVTWSSGSAAVASVDGAGLVTGVRAGTVTIIARAESQTGQLPLTITPAPIASLTTTPDTVTLRTGQTRQLTAIARDAQGNVLSNRPVSWTSSDTLLARVSETGLVTSVSPGEAVITATAENRSSAARITVLQVPVSSVSVSPAAIMMRLGETRQLAAAVQDSAGNALAGRAVTWTSSDTLRAQVTAAGVVSAVGEGQAVITAVSEGRLATASISIFPASTGPVVASIQPATLRPGIEATLTGGFFDPTPAGNTVTIRGVAAEVLTASADYLTVRVPCVGSGSVPVRAMARGVASEPVSHPSVVPLRSVGVGQALILTEYEDVLCNELPAGADTRYVVTVFNSSTSVNSLVDFRLGGNPAEAGQAEPFLRTAAAAAPMFQPRDEQAVRDSTHTAWLERERLLYQQLRSAAQQQPPQSRDAFAQAALPNVGDMRSLFWNRGSCSDASQIIRGRAIYVGSRSIIWEDSANVLQSTVQPQLADYYQRLGRIFDMEQYAVVRDNFGDPLRRDPLTDNDGRIHMVFTQRLNGTETVAYVTNCDQFPRSIAPASNFGEFFYGLVPTQSGSNLNSTNFPDGWFNFMARTVVHEVKHIASLAARIANGAPASEQSWLEEGTARHAEELWVRAHLHKVPWKGNTRFGTAATNGVYCDFVPADPLCMAADPLRRPGFGMRRHFNEFRDKLVAPWNFSPYGAGIDQGRNTSFYQVSWSLVRYVIDRYGSSDAAFLSALNNSTTNGVTNLGSVAGASATEMIGLWGLALYADDYPGLADPHPDIQFPTWNLRDIYARLNQEPAWTARFPSPFMLQPLQLPHGPFSTQRLALRGGSHDYFVIIGNAEVPQLLRLEGPDGGAPSGILRMGIARLR
jgi:uncharacterized protein YjdB